MIQLIPLVEGVYDPSILKVFFLAGGAGSGKSFIVKHTTGGHGYKIVNSDDAFEYLLKKAGMSADIASLSDDEYEIAQQHRDRAKEVTATKLQHYIDGRLGVIIDGTGAKYDKIKRMRKEFHDLGYDSYIIFVNTPLEVAKRRNKNRSRVVPEHILEEDWYAVQQNMGRFQSLFGKHNFVLVDSSTNLDTDVLNSMWKVIMKLTKEPIKNQIGKSWVQNELERKKKSITESIQKSSIISAVKQYDFSKEIILDNNDDVSATFNDITIDLINDLELKFDVTVWYIFHEPEFKGTREQPPDPYELEITDIDIDNIGLWDDGNDIECDFTDIKKEIKKQIVNLF